MSVDTAGFAVPVGQAADVSADITCRVDVADLTVPGAPGAITLTASAVSVLDRYRSR